MTCALKGGERIPEERIAGEFGVSRTPIREAMRRLAEYGLVVLKPRSWAEVVTIDVAEAEHIAEVRASLESLGVRLLAARATPDDGAALRRLADECGTLVEAGDVGAVFEKDSELHLEIAQRSGNACLVEFMERLDAKVQLCRLARCLTLEHVTDAVAQHAPLIEAICRHDAAEAERLVAAHARNLRRQ